ncbi:hypothetical protein ACFYO0_14435 [Streptomyces sp. NPDC006365]|uniref:hypothetical protein n=1 Tax=Streptomyces sp. NPDC006365 TaxID=3364744 RepID=UPI0036B9E8F1
MKLTTRHLVRGKGRHRAVVVPERIKVPLDDLLGPRPQFAAPPVAGVITQAWNPCPRCDKDTAGVVHTDGWTCGECLTTTGSSAP